MNAKQPPELSRRERQIMDIVYAAGEVSAAVVHERISDPPSYSTIRKLLAILVDKGHLQVRREGAKYLYSPTTERQQAGRSALMRVLQTFYEGSLEKAVASLIDPSGSDVSDAELTRLQEMIEAAKAKERSQDDDK